MPEFVFYKFSDETLWKYLQSLSKGSIDRIGTNEENAILNIVKNFKDKNFLYNKLYSTPELVYRIYSNLSEEGKDDYVHFLTKLTRDYKGKEEPKENEYAYVGEFETTDFPNYKKIWEGKSFYQYITPNKNDFSSTVNVHTEIVRANFLNVGSYEKHHTVNVVQNKNLLDKIYIYKGNRTQREVFPGIYVAYLGEKFDKEELLKTLNRASFLLGSYGASRALFVKGASTLVKTAAVVELTNLTISAYMQNESHRKEIENMGVGGKWFVENWSTISTLTDLATFSVAILDDLPKVSAKLQKEGVDTKELDTFVEKARREVGKRTAESSRSLKRLLTNEDYKRIYNDFVSGKITRKFTKELSLEEEAVLRFYTTKEGYKNFNRALRGEIPMTDFYISQKKLMNQALKKLPTSNHNNSLLYRIEDLSGDKISELYVQGSIIKTKGFTSATYSEDAVIEAMRNRPYTVLIRIEGKDGKLIEGLSTLPSEKEILFKSETIFKVEKVGFSPNPEDYMIPIKTIWLKEL